MKVYSELPLTTQQGDVSTIYDYHIISAVI